MSFCEEFKNIDYGAVRDDIHLKDEADVRSSLAKSKIGYDDFLALLSEEAEGFIEEMAQRANRITKQRFGNTINLYAPLYLSNECTNICLYCGFNKDNEVTRVTLSVDEALKEADILHETGIRDILLVSGDVPDIITIDYLSEIAAKLKSKFASIAVEVYPMSKAGYERIEAAGCDSVTIYQETYDEKLYGKLHVQGGKSDFYHRLDTPDRGGEAGMRRIGIGILMGLGDWRTDCAILGAHAAYLTKKYWKSKISVSFPRLRPAKGGFKPLYNVSDKNLLQAITAFRLYLNDIGIVLSTRERAELRDNLVKVGITQMSAGSRTNPGGYSNNTDSCEQFEIEDLRSPATVSEKLHQLGYDPVFKDWQA